MAQPGAPGSVPGAPPELLPSPSAACPSTGVHVLEVPKPCGCCVGNEPVPLGSPAQDTHTTPHLLLGSALPSPDHAASSTLQGSAFALQSSSSPALFIVVAADPAHGTLLARTQRPATGLLPHELQLHSCSCQCARWPRLLFALHSRGGGLRVPVPSSPAAVGARQSALFTWVNHCSRRAGSIYLVPLP